MVPMKPRNYIPSDARFKELRKKTVVMLKAIRQTKGIKLREMARMMDMAPENLCRVENGNILPGILLLDRYAEALGYEIIINVTIQRKGLQDS